MKDRHPSTSPYGARASAPVTRAAALLMLDAALLHHGGAASALGAEAWARVVRRLSPRQILALAMYGVAGTSMPRVAEWLGTSRAAVSNDYRAACRALRACPEARRLLGAA